MMMDILFVPTTKVVDTETEHTCGTCGPQPIANFYKDGKDKDGNIRYRRDCKNCYRIARLNTRRYKAGPKLPTVKERLKAQANRRK